MRRKSFVPVHPLHNAEIPTFASVAVIVIFVIYFAAVLPPLV
ncbi:hypothetical protein [Burkholderia aenigmatica]|nr:hypothetical protein [Burkholderia aenigmatica]MDN7880090.1 hypothetical protein [Burkholderia aenigmatica]